MNLIEEPKSNRLKRIVPIEDDGLQRNEEEIREAIRKSDEFLRDSERIRDVDFYLKLIERFPC